MDRFAIINRYHVEMLAYFLDKLKSTPDGDGTLLDHSLVLYGSSMSNGNDHDPLPVILAGGASGKLRDGRHMQYAPHTPMSNLLLSMLDKLGIDQASLSRPMQAAWISAASFASSALVPIAALLLAPAALRIPAIAAVSLLALGVLGALGGHLGGASMSRGALRVTFGGALAMAVTAWVGHIFGVVAG